MLSVGFFGGSVRPSSPGMPRPHRSPPPFFAWRTTEDPKRPPRDPKRPSRRYKMLSGSSPQQLCTPNPSAAPSCRPSSPNASPGAFGSPNTTHRDPEYPSQDPAEPPEDSPNPPRDPTDPRNAKCHLSGPPRTPKYPEKPPTPHPHRPRLAVVGVAVRDDFGQLHDPVVDFIPPAPLHCEGKEGGTREGGGGASPLKAQSHPHSRPPFSRDYSSHDAPGDAALPACTAALLNCVSQHALQHGLYLAARLGGCPIDA